MPHSEIVGSKVAHTSPTLIAACHVLHRLCMPRHPPNALTSHLRVHITNNSPATHKRTGTIIGSWSLSQLNAYLAPDPHKRADQTPHYGIDLEKTHSQCQTNRHAISAPHTSHTGRISDASTWNMVEPVGIEPTTSSLQS